MELMFKRLEFVISQASEIASKFDVAKPDDITIFCTCMLDRLNFGAESLRVLIKNDEGRSRTEYGCGIVIRSLLLDNLIALNAWDVYGKNLSDLNVLETELSEFCLAMLCDSVNHTVKHFSKLKGHIPANFLLQLQKNLISGNPNCFEDSKPSGELPKIKVDSRVSSVELLETVIKSDTLKDWRWVYTAYLYYSKYDHFGNMYYKLSRTSEAERTHYLKISVSVLPITLFVVTTILTTFAGEGTWVDVRRKEILSFVNETREVM